MIIFKIYTLEKVRNNQMTAEKFFDSVVMDIFKFYTYKCSKQAKSFKEFFKNAFKMILQKICT